MTSKGSRKRLNIYVGSIEYPQPRNNIRAVVKYVNERERQRKLLTEIAKKVRAVEWDIYLCDHTPAMGDDGHLAFSKIGWRVKLVFRSPKDPIASAAMSSELIHECIEQDIDVKKFLSFEIAVFQEVRA